MSIVAMTIRDIAREAGVSTATVSRTLRGLPNVDPTTRRHVMTVAEHMDYVISPTASRLATDGFLVLSLDPEGDDVLALFDLDLPVVLIGMASNRAVGTIVDDVAGARMATEHLIESGTGTWR